MLNLRKNNKELNFTNDILGFPNRIADDKVLDLVLTKQEDFSFEPNSRITVYDEKSGIFGDYIIKSISLPLDVTSTMSINAYKALQKI